MSTAAPGSSAVAASGKPWLPDLALLSVALIWGFNIPVMKVALAELHPFAFNAARLSLSAAFLGALLAWERRSHRPRPPRTRRRRWRRVAAIGLCGGFFYQLAFITGVDRTTGSNTALLLAGSPLWTALIARAAGTERITAGAFAGLAVAFAGTAWVTVEGGAIDLGGERLVGNLLVLVSSFLWASSTVMSKALVGELSPTLLAFLTTTTMLPLHLAVAVPHLGPVVRLAPSATAWFCVIYSGLLSTGLAYSLWNFGIRQVGPSHTAIYTNVVPVLGIASSAWVLGEALTAWQIAGGTLILGGLVLMRRARERNRPKPRAA